MQRSVVRAHPPLLTAIAAALALCVGANASRPTDGWTQVRTLKITYRTHDGRHRHAYVLLPLWYGPGRDPPLPLVISPHGRGVDGRSNARLWGELPAEGGFAVVNPDGQGRKLAKLSWGYRGQIDDLAAMPKLVERALPWLRIDRHRIYAFGGSMGGQETLLLAERHPTLLAGAAAFDSVTDLRLQYRNLPRLTCDRVCTRHWKQPLGAGLRKLLRREVGGTPATAPRAYTARSPITYARRLARSDVPLQLWWSRSDHVVFDQRLQSARLYRRIAHANPDAPVTGYVGSWEHSLEMHALLPFALESFGLLADVSPFTPPGVVVLTPSPRTTAGASAAACPLLRLGSAYVRSVERALHSKRDVWGEAMIRAPNGPTYEAVNRRLTPLLRIRHAYGRPLTASGAYYVPFGQPTSPDGAGSVALHVADGSQIFAERGHGRRLGVWVGANGRERYGACRARLVTPRLAEGYLPILETRYRDAFGTRYAQESFATHLPGVRSLVSFVRMTIDARGATAGTQLRFVDSTRGLTVNGNALVRGGKTYAVFGAGGTFRRASASYLVHPGTVATVYAEWLVHPERLAPQSLDDATYARARDSVFSYWTRRLAEGAQFVVPDQHALDAERNLLIQNLQLGWRYSIGNDYEEFEWPESADGASVLAEYGFADAARSIVQTTLRRPLVIYPNWDRGEKLLSTAMYYRLVRDAKLVAAATPGLSAQVDALARQLARGGHGLLPPERYASDLPDRVYALDSQTVIWQGLRAMATVWAQTGRPVLARRADAVASRLGAGLRRALRLSERRLRDGTLFLPVKLLAGERPYELVPATRAGSYWNLVIPYALASGLVAPGSAQARGALEYLLRHGSRLLGLVRSGGYELPRRRGPFRPAGSDEVYGLDMARFLADNGRADQLVLSLYGQLGATLAPGTFIAGEGVSIGPFPREYFRRMYLPPNSIANATFLEKLRLMLVHETPSFSAAPSGLQLAYATPRPWLRPGKEILVREAPTAFGPVSYSLRAGASSIEAVVDVPARPRPRTLTLRLRLPHGRQITGVTLAGQPFRRFSRRSGTIDLSGLSGELDLVVGYR